MELVSIVIPVYNVQDYVKCCLDSVISQTYKALEIILIDDGSTDKSGKICDDYAKMDNRIVVIHKENGGLSDARNVGIDSATGKYVCFVDSDDFIHPLYVEFLYKACEENKAQVSICNYQKVYEHRNVKGNQIRLDRVVFEREQMLSQWHTEYTDIETVAWNKLYLKSLFDAGDKIRYPLGKLYEDVVTTHKIINASERVVILDNSLYFYFQRKDSIMGSNFSIKKFEDSIWAQKQRVNYFKDTQYMSTYHRLEIFSAKGVMLNYCRGKKYLIDFDDGLKNVCIDFSLMYKKLIQYPECKVSDRLLFFVFRHFPIICEKFLINIYDSYKS